MKTMEFTPDLGEKISEQFTEWSATLNGAKSTEAYKRKEKAFQSLSKIGFPSVKDEEWKYTNVKQLVSQPVALKPETSISKVEVEEAIPEGLDANVVVFLNGEFQEEFLDLKEESFQFATLQQAFTQKHALLDTYFAQVTDAESNGFVALNTAAAQQGIVLEVPKSSVVEKPILVLHFLKGADALAQIRNLVVVRENAQANIIEITVALDDNHYWVNQVTEMVVEKHARLDQVILQKDQPNVSATTSTQAKQAGESHFSNSTLTLGGKLIRNDLKIDMEGEHSESFMNGLYLLHEKSHVDNHTAVDHQQPNCYSNELYKGILDGNSTGVFNGKIFVRPGAQKTNAFQSNKNILLSENASVDTKPQLEIWADDVKCSHGATTGTLDEEPLFYLQARGIPKEKARALLMLAFAGDVIEKIKSEPIRQLVESWVFARLGYAEL